MTWKTLENETQLHHLIELSHTKTQVIFKHSTRCSISNVAKSRMDRANIDAIDFYYLDLIEHRQLSNLIAEKFSVHHESPQVLLIKNGECIFDESHTGINIEELEKVAASCI